MNPLKIQLCCAHYLLNVSVLGLQGLYSDMDRLFRSDLFHMGGDEVNINCWNSSAVVSDWMSKKLVESSVKTYLF